MLSPRKNYGGFVEKRCVPATTDDSADTLKLSIFFWDSIETF